MTYVVQEFYAEPLWKSCSKKEGTQNKVIINGNIDYTRNPHMISVENLTINTRSECL